MSVPCFQCPPALRPPHILTENNKQEDFCNAQSTLWMMRLGGGPGGAWGLGAGRRKTRSEISSLFFPICTAALSVLNFLEPNDCHRASTYSARLCLRYLWFMDIAVAFCCSLSHHYYIDIYRSVSAPSPLSSSVPPGLSVSLLPSKPPSVPVQNTKERVEKNTQDRSPVGG